VHNIPLTCALVAASEISGATRRESELLGLIREGKVEAVRKLLEADSSPKDSKSAEAGAKEQKSVDVLSSAQFVTLARAAINAMNLEVCGWEGRGVWTWVWWFIVSLPLAFFLRVE
jgi:hypothetical protein